MDDLISRQAAIDVLHQWFADGFEEDRWWNSTHVLAALEGLPSAELEQRWIPCSERMPKKTGYYICTCHDGTYYRTSVLKWSTGWTLTGARSYWKVIAWMPLPEPYAERRQDD